MQPTVCEPGLASTSPNTLQRRWTCFCWNRAQPPGSGEKVSHVVTGLLRSLSKRTALVNDWKAPRASCLTHCRAHSLRMTDTHADGDIPHRKWTALPHKWPSFEFSQNQRQPESTRDPVTLAGLGRSIAPQQRTQTTGLPTALLTAWSPRSRRSGSHLPRPPEPRRYAVAKQLGVTNPSTPTLSLFPGSHPISFLPHLPCPLLFSSALHCKWPRTGVLLPSSV